MFHPLFLTINIKMDRIITNILYIVFQVLKVLLIKICEMQSLDVLFLVVFISFYISRYNFSHVFRTSFNIIWKKDFRRKFSFFNGFTQTPTPLPPWQPKFASVTNAFCQCSLTYHGFQDYYAMITLNSRAELIVQSNFNPRVAVFI